MAFTGSVRRPTRPARSPWLIAIMVVAVLVVLAGTAVGIALLVRSGDTVGVHASSSAAGSDLDTLASGRSDVVSWRSDAQTTGAWVEERWPTKRSVDHVVVSGAGSRSYSSARLTFSDGSALLVTPDVKGLVDLSFPARSVDSVRLTVAEPVKGRSSVQLASFVVSGGTVGRSASSEAVRAEASSSAPGASAAALVDGNAAKGDLGAEWLADPAATSARVELRWTGVRELASVDVWGPTAAALDPAYTAAAALNGSLRFSDGSSVRVSGIAGGADGPTTVAFTPRMASSVTVVLAKTIPQATIGLRGVVVRDAGRATAPRAADTAYRAQAPAAASPCDAASSPVGAAAAGVVSLVCPATGTTVDGTATIVVTAVAGADLAATVGTAVTADGDVTQVAESKAGTDGRATLRFATAALPHGPMNVAIASSDGSLRTLHAQLYNAGGRKDAAPAAQRGGATLAWDDEFDRGLSISATGEGTTYGALKPEYYGGSQFGDAVFDDPTSGAGTFSVVDDDYLRIRVQPIGTRSDPGGYDRKFLGGLLSSLRVGASGFSAQYGYYETRMMSPGANGTWPAFWMMNDDSATKVTDTSAEVDAVELYGNRTRQTCHSIHDYVAKKDNGTVRCISTAIRTDWALGWHTYGVRIEPGRARFYVDGKLVMTETGLTHSDEPFYFMANLALGGGWPVDLAPMGNQADLWIDYVRVYV